MTATSRVLKRHARSFFDRSKDEEGDGTFPISLPQSMTSSDPSWECPSGIDNPFKFGCYVLRLHRHKNLTPSFCKEVYMRFASAHCKKYGYEKLCRAAHRAATLSRYSFSPKMISEMLADVPDNPQFATPIELF